MSTSEYSLPISSMIQAYRCPRRHYFSKNNSPPVSDRYTVCKEVSLSHQDNRDENAIWDDICLINPEINEEMREYLSSCLEINVRTPLPAWTETNLRVRSEKYGIHGLIDKYHDTDRKISIVRCTAAPLAGCWPADRVRMASYLLCLKESTGIDLSGGYIEYIPDGIIRFCEPQPRDRREFLTTLKKARMVEKGDLPEKPLRAPCKNCRYSEQCDPPKVKKLSEILFKKR